MTFGESYVGCISDVEINNNIQIVTDISLPSLVTEGCIRTNFCERNLSTCLMRGNCEDKWDDFKLDFLITVFFIYKFKA